MLHVRGVVKAFGKRSVLRGVNLDVPPGQILGLVGANGAGKTTLISIVAGLSHPDAGTIIVAGVDARAHPKQVARDIGLAPQKLGIYPTLTVRENLICFARLAGLGIRVASIRAEEVAELFGLGDRYSQRAEELSGGQQRRLHTGVALLGRPKLLFLDEPTVGADVQARADILQIVKSMASEGTSVVYTTHYLTELEQLDAEIAILNKGVIAVRGSCREVVQRYGQSSATLRFVGHAPQLAGWTAFDSYLTSTHPIAEPGKAAAQAVISLGDRAMDLVGIDVTRPTLESSYRAVTGCALNEANAR